MGKSCGSLGYLTARAVRCTLSTPRCMCFLVKAEMTIQILILLIFNLDNTKAGTAAACLFGTGVPWILLTSHGIDRPPSSSQKVLGIHSIFLSRLSNGSFFPVRVCWVYDSRVIANGTSVIQHCLLKPTPLWGWESLLCKPVNGI